MSKCCGDSKNVEAKAVDPCSPPPSPCCSSAAADAAGEDECPLTWFQNMIPHCLAHAEAAKADGKPVVGILCEYTPRELILAAGGVPVCLCGGSADTIATAEEELPANLCPLIKSTYGYHVEKSNPFLEMADLIVAETTCDGKKKMYEMLSQSRPMYVLELPQKPDSPEAMVYWRSELVALKSELERRFDVEITDERIRDAIGRMNRERQLRRELAALMKADRPPLTGRQLLDLKSSISCIPADLDQYAKAVEMFSGQAGPAEMADRVRVLMTGVPIPHGAERVLDIIEDHGGLVVCMENCTGVKPIYEDVDVDADDSVDALAEMYFHLPCSVMTPNRARLERLGELAAEYRPQCVVELIWQACLTYDVESFLVKRYVEDELHVPYLRISTDYSPSDSARITVRVEALFETVRGVAGKAGCK